jgi:hypothetical protein
MDDFSLSATCSIPSMPLHPVNEVGLIAYTTCMAAISVVLLIWWAVSVERHNYGFLLPLVMLGGLLAALQEPILDILVLVWYPVTDYLVAFKAFGRHVPWLVPIGYVWFVGGLPYLVYRLLCVGIYGRRLWWVFACIMVIDCIAITAAFVLAGVGGFYGKQPFNLWGYPFWWAGLDGAQPIVGGVGLYWLVPRLNKGWQKALAAVLMPTMSLGATSGAVVSPIALALNTDQPRHIMHLAGAATFALGCMLVWVCVFLSEAERNSCSPVAEFSIGSVPMRVGMGPIG